MTAKVVSLPQIPFLSPIILTVKWKTALYWPPYLHFTHQNTSLNIYCLLFYVKHLDKKTLIEAACNRF